MTKAHIETVYSKLDLTLLSTLCNIMMILTEVQTKRKIERNLEVWRMQTGK
jgi:hypothetical protein